MTTEKVSDSDRPTFEGKPVLTQIDAEKIGKYVLLIVRDPLIFTKDPAEEIAERLTDFYKVGVTGMYVTYTGKYHDVELSVMSTGSGAPDTETALAELIINTKADTFIRIGCSGGLQDYLRVGDLIICSGAVRDEGTTGEYIPKSYPAQAHFEVLMALIEAAERLNIKYHVGIIRSNDSFWVGQGRVFKTYLQPEHQKIVEYWRKAGVMSVEREASTIFTLTNLFGLRGGSVVSVVNNRVTGDLEIGAGIQEAITTALESIRILHKWDRIKAKRGKRYWYPSLQS